MLGYGGVVKLWPAGIQLVIGEGSRPRWRPPPASLTRRAIAASLVGGIAGAVGVGCRSSLRCERLIMLVDHDHRARPLLPVAPSVGAHRPHRHPFDPSAPRCRFQRPGHAGARIMTTKNFEDLYTAEISEPATEGEGVMLDDFVAYMPSHAYIFTPCREIWPAASVNARLERIPVLGKNGKPKRRQR